MANISSVPFSRERLDDLFRLISANAKARWPKATYLLNSDVAWRLPGSAPKENIMLWYDDAGIAAFAWFVPNSPVTFDVRCDIEISQLMLTEVITWLAARTRAFPAMHPWLLSLTSMAEWEQALTDNLASTPCDKRHLQVAVLDQDNTRQTFLTDMGFEPTEHFDYFMIRSLDDPIPDSNLANGFRLRSVEEPDFMQRVATHRDAWFKSVFSLDQYLRTRSIDVFEPTLDIVAEDTHGHFGAYCIGWVDRELGVGSFEPVGTRPQYRRRGLGQAVNYEGLRRMKAMGMHSAKIGTAGFNDRAFELYRSCGFSLSDKNRTWIKEIDP